MLFKKQNCAYLLQTYLILIFQEKNELIFFHTFHFVKKYETLSKHVNTALNGPLLCTPMKLFF